MPTYSNRRIKFSFVNGQGLQLAALLELPDGSPRAFALFAHCFTCSKESLAATRVCRALAQHGFAVLRFDFTGLGGSEGDFSNTNFSSNVDDLVSAADHLREQYQAPSLLVGHSLGGAAVLAAASRIPESTAVVTIAAPCDLDRVAGLFGDKFREVEFHGETIVHLHGRSFKLKRQFLDDIAERRLVNEIHDLGKALLVFHSPVDEVVGIENARRIYEAARHPKSFISLDKADHLLGRREDAEYVAQTISAWASRYVLTERQQGDRPTVDRGTVLVQESDTLYTQEIYSDRHQWRIDEPLTVGGSDNGPSPYEALLGALGACTAITLRMYAQRKSLQLDNVEVELRHEREHARDCDDCPESGGKLGVITSKVRISGTLTGEQFDRLVEIAQRCPVHRTLTDRVTIRTVPESV